VGSQLALFEVPTRTPNPWLGPHPEGPEASAPRQSLPGGLVACQQTETAGEQLYYIYNGSTWLGTLFHVGGAMWSIYLPGERGVADFGGPNLRGAAKQLTVLVAKQKGACNV
jgi:hypothetical protein